MEIANVSHSLVNGPGVRLVLWLQGCSHDCKGCFSPESQKTGIGKNVSAKKMADVTKNYMREYKFDGLSITGGDPFYQATDLKIFLKRLRKFSPDIDIHCWTGFSLEEIQTDSDMMECMNHIDTLICDRYEHEQRYDADDPHPLKGSKNQRILTLKEGKIINTEK